MKYTEFLPEGKVYKALSIAERAAEKLGHKVVKSDNGYFTTAEHDDPRPKVVSNALRTELEPRLKEELKKLQKQKRDFLALKAKVESGFLYGKEYKDQISKEKWKEITQNLKGINKQLKFLPKKYDEVPAVNKSALERIVQAIEENKWSLVESSFDVQFLSCKLYDDTTKNLDPTVKQKLESFKQFKKDYPLKPFGGTDRTLGLSHTPYGGMKLMHAHLARDAVLVYSINGKDPIQIKLYGVFKHDDLGIGQPANKRKSANMATQLSNQGFGTLKEESPDTLEGSFTPDLVNSKVWLCQKLAKLLKGKSAGRIYALGSWYGNIGIFLQQAGVKFDDLVLVETDEKLLDRSEKLLQPLYDEGKLLLLHQDAKDVVYEHPATVINCSTNDMDTNWLTNIPKNVLILMQGRNNLDDVPTRIPTLEKFDDLFPLRRVFFLGEIPLKDPETKYQRFMKIGSK